MVMLRIVAGAVLVLSLLGCGSTDNGEAAALVEAICCGSTCCLIDGDCLNTGDDLGDPCFVCMPANSQTELTDLIDCGAGGSGGDGGSGTGGSGGDGGSGTGGSGGGAGGSGGDGGSAGGGGGDSSGCAVTSQSPSHSAAWLLAAVGVCLAVRRRPRLRS